MTDLQEKAMRMALEILETDQSQLHWQAVRTLRQALAQPGQGYALIHKDVLRAWGKLDEIESACCYPVSKEKEIAGLALAQPAQDPICAHGVCKTKCDFCKQPEQEPVGTYEGVMERMLALLRGTVQQMEVYEHFKNIPLYTAPPKREWKGLTSDDKHFLLANAWNKEQAFDGFMDAIDKFLEEKNT